MKEVKEKRYAGPYLPENFPFEHFIQSPIGLVPKDGGKKTRLIFHLSYPRNHTSKKSVNANIPRDECVVKYQDFDQAVRRCIEEGKSCYMSKSDMSMAFRNVPLSRNSWKFLVLKARHPEINQWYYFIDKCLPFGALISCKIFQEFSNAVSHIVQYFVKKENINYLDDFFFIALMKWLCNHQTQVFLDVCQKYNFQYHLKRRSGQPHN